MYSIILFCITGLLFDTDNESQAIKKTFCEGRCDQVIKNRISGDNKVVPIEHKVYQCIQLLPCFCFSLYNIRACVLTMSSSLHTVFVCINTQYFYYAILPPPGHDFGRWLLNTYLTIHLDMLSFAQPVNQEDSVFFVLSALQSLQQCLIFKFSIFQI